MVGSFWRARQGNIAILTALCLLIIFAFAGGAVDFLRYTNIRSEIQAASDGAVLAAASLSNDRDPATVAIDYFEKNFDGNRFNIPPVNFVPNVISDTTTQKTVSATASVDMPTLLLGVMKIAGNDMSKLRISVKSQASESVGAVEIALVLDESDSMNTNNKIVELRTAAEDFVTRIMDNSHPGSTSISIIPYGFSVNIEPVFTDYADTSAVTGTITRHCIFYDPADYTGDRITGLRQPVDQTSADLHDQCSPNPVLLNSKVKSDMITKVQALGSTGNTDSHMGMMWGLKSLNPSMRGYLGGDDPARPHDFGDDTLKVIVMMTDGRIFPNPDDMGYRPLAEAQAHFDDLCQEAKDDGIVVFAIGYDMTAGSPEDQNLKDCATSPSHYYFNDTLDLSSAFDGIAASISRLRVTE